MKKRTTSKLRLNRETVRKLGSASLSEARGGTFHTLCACTDTCCTCITDCDSCEQICQFQTQSCQQICCP